MEILDRLNLVQAVGLELKLGLGLISGSSRQLALESKARLGLGSGMGLQEVFVLDSKRENGDRAVEAVSEARAY